MNAWLPLRSTVLACALAGVLASAAGAAAPASVSRLAQQVLERGKEAQLPPHLALTLLIGDGTHPVPVRQIATRVGTVVHTINVVSGAHRQVVLISADEASHETSAYLQRAGGSVSRAVRYLDGGAPEALAAAAAAAGYRSELRYWTQALGALSPRSAAHGPGAAAPHP